MAISRQIFARIWCIYNEENNKRVSLQAVVAAQNISPAITNLYTNANKQSSSRWEPNPFKNLE